VTEFDEVAFSLEPGQVYTDVVKSQFGYHIIKLEEYDPNRELEEYTLQARKSQVLQDWLTEQQDTAKIERFWSRDKVPTTAPQRIPIPR
jgi:parvulin-like peptidyl-prolyl isomerase